MRKRNTENAGRYGCDRVLQGAAHRGAHSASFPQKRQGSEEISQTENAESAENVEMKTRRIRDAEATILLKFAFWRGLGRGKIYGKLSKTLFLFPGKFHDNKIWRTLRILLSEILLSFGRLLENAENAVAIECFRGGIQRGAILLHLCCSPDPCFMQQND